MSPDRRAADRLNEHLDAIATGSASQPRDLDSALGATVERFFAADDTPAPPPDLAARLWEHLIEPAAPVALTPHPPVTWPNQNQNGRTPPLPRGATPPSHGPSPWAFLATAALIALAVIGSFAVLRRSPPATEQQAIVIDAIDQTPEGGSPAANPDTAAGLAEFVAEIRLGSGLSNTPSGIAVDGDGTIYVINATEDRIQRFGRDGQPVGPWGETGSGPGQFRFRANAASWGDLAFGPDGNLYVLDPFNSRVQILGPDGAFVREWGEAGGGDGQFVEPSGLAVDASGRVYVADTLNGRVQVFDGEGRFLAAWSPSDNGGGLLRSPIGVAVDAAGTVSVTDRASKQVVRLAADGSFLGSFGGAGADAGRLGDPVGVTSDALGNVFVADTVGNRIQVFAPDGSLLGAIGEIGVQPGQFLAPGHLTIAPDGLLYVSDEGNRRIQVFRIISAGNGAPANAPEAAPAEPAPEGWGTGDTIV